MAVILVTAGCTRQSLPDPQILDEMVLVPAVDAGQCSSPTETKAYTRKCYFGEPKFAVYPVIYNGHGRQRMGVGCRLMPGCLLCQLPLAESQGPLQGEYRILRGGSWHMRDSVVRTAYRKTFQTDHRYYYIGFRCARNP
jgi:hypothetical protein